MSLSESALMEAIPHANLTTFQRPENSSPLALNLKMGPKMMPAAEEAKHDHRAAGRGIISLQNNG